MSQLSPAPGGNRPARGHDPLSVLLVTHYYAEHRGGVEIVAGELASRLAHRGVRVEWAASRPAPPVAADEQVRPLPMATCNVTERRLGFPYPIWGPLSVLRMLRAVRRADLVHLHDSLYLGNAIAYVWARALGKPILVTQHIGEVPYSSRLLRGMLWTANHTLGRFVLGGSSQVVFIADKVQAYFSAFTKFRAPPRLIPNGVERGLFFPVDEPQRRQLREQLGWESGRPALLFVGRFVEKKGLRILRELAGRLPDCQWVFIGWGPDDPSGWGLPNVRTLGAIPHADLPRYYRAADLLVLPSSGEGFPLVVQEAMACGTPALISPDTASGAAGVEQAALVCELAPEKLAACLQDWLARPNDLLARRGVVARYAQDHWDWDACAARYHELYRRLLPAARQAETKDEQS